MNEHINDLLPFYVNETLQVEKRGSVEAHLSACPTCRLALKEWEDLAEAVRSANSAHSQAAPIGSLPAQDFPPLSPVVRANLRRKPSLLEAVLGTSSLIGAQRVYLKENWLIQTVSAILLIGVLATLFIPVENKLRSAVPFFVLVPFLAVLAISFFETQGEDLGDEVVVATPTHPGVLIFARLTLAVGAIAGLSLLGSILISGFGKVSLGWLVLTWLGPTLWLSALTTLLALLWNPWAAAGASVTLWGGMILLMVGGLNRDSLMGASLIALLAPGWSLFGAQVILAGILWLASWLWLFWGNLPALRLERGG